MHLPEMTSLQFLVVHLLFRGERTGKQLAGGLAKLGVRRSQPSFSRLMHRLIVQGYVHVECRVRTEGSQVIREHHYAVTDVGVTHWHATREFYSTLSLPPPGLVPVKTVPAKYARADRKTRDKFFKRKLTKAMSRFVDAKLAAKGRRRR